MALNIRTAIRGMVRWYVVMGIPLVVMMVAAITIEHIDGDPEKIRILYSDIKGIVIECHIVFALITICIMFLSLVDVIRRRKV